MSTLLYSLGRWSFRHPWRVLVAWLLVLGIAGGGALALNQGTDNTFSIPGTESQAGLEQLSRTFPQVSGTSAQIIVVAADGDTVDAPAYKQPIEDTVTELGALEGVLSATSPFDEIVTGMVNDDASAAIIRLQFDGQATDVPQQSVDELEQIDASLQQALPQGARAALGGDLFATSIPALSITEAVGLVIALLVLIVTFRSFVVAGLPLLTAIIGVGISMAAIFAATKFATVSSTTPLLALMLGLAVGIDYALFIVSRHQDQVRSGVNPEESAARATGTAGSAVVFAGVTVLIALIGLGFAGIPFLTTMGVAASVAVAIAVAIAVTLTPALLGFMGARVAGRPRPARKKKAQKGGVAATEHTFSTKWVNGVTKHPVLVAVAVVVGLGVAAVPAASLTLALPNAGMLPTDSSVRQSYDLAADHFGPGFNGPLVLTGTIVTSTDPLGLMDDLRRDVEKIPGVAEVALSTPNETADTGIVQVIPSTAPDAPETADLVRELRAQHDRWLDEFGIDIQVTGFTAVAIDISDQLGEALLPFGVFVIGLSLVLLAIVFRSIWVPVTAAAGYLLSILAAFGVVSAVFEWGWFADALQVSRVGPVISFMPIVLMGVLFGLAMDYQVFLVSRMREDFVHAQRSAQAASPTGTITPAESHRLARTAVRTGFTGSARVVTAAALIMFAVFVAFVPEGDSSLKAIALGLAAGIAIDAFLVRMTLIPALMAILGRHAWWLPRWMQRALPRVDIEGEAVEHELEYADWPGDDSLIASKNLTLADSSDGLAMPDVRIAPGEAIVVTGREHERTMLALALAGRVPVAEGLLRVDGHLLPGRASWVRKSVGVVRIDPHEPAAIHAELREALRGEPALLIIDGVDRMSTTDRDNTVRLLSSAAHRNATLVVTAHTRASAESVVTDAGWATPRVIDITGPRRTRTDHAAHRASGARAADNTTHSTEVTV